MLELSLGLSIAAILFTIINTYFQWFRVKGARIELLNTHHNQRSVTRSYAGLPKNIQDDFPDYPDEWPGYALVKLVFGNSGDRAGLVNIINIGIENDHGLFKKSYYSYTLIPAYEIVEKEILLRNIPIGPNPIEIEVILTIEWGGYHPRSGKYMLKGTKEKSLRVTLISPSENPPPVQNVTSIG